MKESVVAFGPSNILNGILTEPSIPNPNAPVLVMSNVGLNHRVGPSRMWVELGRRFATRGFTSLRFDIAGLGDSLPRDDVHGSDIDRAILDLEDALSWLGSRGAKRFALFSLCSGTDNAHVVAVRDERVCCAAFLDGYTYQTTRSWIQRVSINKFSRVRWRRWLRRKFPGLFCPHLKGLLPKYRDEIFERQYPARSSFEADVSTMVDRGAHLIFLFSGESDYLYEGQFRDWMERKAWSDHLQVFYQKKANHTYTFEADRELLFGTIENWLLGVVDQLPRIT